MTTVLTSVELQQMLLSWLKPSSCRWQSQVSLCTSVCCLWCSCSWFLTVRHDRQKSKLRLIYCSLLSWLRFTFTSRGPGQQQRNLHSFTCRIWSSSCSCSGLFGCCWCLVFFLQETTNICWWRNRRWWCPLTCNRPVYTTVCFTCWICILSVGVSSGIDQMFEVLHQDVLVSVMFPLTSRYLTHVKGFV